MYKVGDMVYVDHRVDEWYDPRDGDTMRWGLDEDLAIGHRLEVLLVASDSSHAMYILRSDKYCACNYWFPESSLGDEIGKQLEFSFMKDPDELKD